MLHGVSGLQCTKSINNSYFCQVAFQLLSPRLTWCLGLLRPQGQDWYFPMWNIVRMLSAHSSSLLRSLWVTLQRISHSCSSIQAFWYLCLIFYPVIWTDLECWRCNSWKSNSSPGLPFPPGLPLHMIVFVHAKVCSPEVHSGGPAICLVPSSRECELHHLISQYYSQSSLPQPDLHCL